MNLREAFSTAGPVLLEAPSAPPPLDVVIIAYNNPDITTRSVLSVLYGEPHARIILVDNGSKEPFKGLKPLLKAGGHTYLRLPQNLGPYGAANAGIAQVKTERFAFMCNDCAILPGSLRRLSALVSDEYPYVSATEFQADRFDSYYALPFATPDAARIGPGVFFTCFVTKKAFADKVGLFDERYRLTYGDTDWEQRANDLLKKEGKSLVRSPSVKVFHGASVTRKRLGLEADLRVDLADLRAFHEKWKDRPDVLQAHPGEDIDRKRAYTANEWSYRGEK
jgi:GT2 family glycosyltransferase